MLEETEEVFSGISTAAFLAIGVVVDIGSGICSFIGRALGLKKDNNRK